MYDSIVFYVHELYIAVCMLEVCTYLEAANLFTCVCTYVHVCVSGEGRGAKGPLAPHCELHNTHTHST